MKKKSLRWSVWRMDKAIKAATSVKIRLLRIDVEGAYLVIKDKFWNSEPNAESTDFPHSTATPHLWSLDVINYCSFVHSHHSSLLHFTNLPFLGFTKLSLSRSGIFNFTFNSLLWFLKILLNFLTFKNNILIFLRL